MADFSNYNVSRLRNELKNEKLHALQEAGLIQDLKVMNYLESYRDNYTAGQGVHYQDDTKTATEYHNSKTYVETVREEINKVLSQAVRRGNQSIIAHALGLAENDHEDLETAYSVILDELEKDASVSMIRGAPGTGKTTKAIKIAFQAQEFGVIDRVCTNIAISEPEKLGGWEYKTKLSEQLRFSQKSGNKLLIWDEISRLLNMKAGNKSDAYDAAGLVGNLFPALRKQSDGNLKIIVIAHRDNSDTFKVIRSYTNLVINSFDRQNKDKAQLYLDHPLDSPEYAWDRFEADNINADHTVEGFNDIRNPWLSINTNKSARLELDTDNIQKDEYPEIFNSLGEESNSETNENVFSKVEEEEKQQAGQEYRETDKSLREVGEKYGFSKDTVRRYADQAT